MGSYRALDNLYRDVTVRRSRRARRMTLRVSQLDGRVTLTVPEHTGDRAARDFLASHTDWIDKAQSKVADEVLVKPGAELPVEGKMLAIHASSGRRTVMFPDHIEMSSPKALAARLKHLARDRAMPRVDHYAGEVGRDVGRVTFRDTRSRWGSCTTDGNLMLSWRLILAPPEVFDYVIAHEVAHLVEMNHSSAFWSVVEELCPTYKTHKSWLRRDGPGLHRYRFD